MVVKVKENFEKTRDVRRNRKFEIYILQGENNVRYYNKTLYNQQKSNKTMLIY